MLELLVATGILAVLASLLLPAIQQSREAARRTQCQNNLRQLGLALTHYESTHGTFPYGCGGTDGGPDTNRCRLSGLVPLAPYLDVPVLWDRVAHPPVRYDADLEPILDRPMGPVPWDGAFDPWTTQIITLLCPSDGATVQGIADTNYAFCWGDHPHAAADHGSDRRDPPAARGLFMRVCGDAGRTFGARDVRDGTSHTILMGEIGRFDGTLSFTGSTTFGRDGLDENPHGACWEGVADPGNPGYHRRGYGYGPDAEIDFGPSEETDADDAHGRGTRWCDGSPVMTGFLTLFPPNGPNCVAGQTELGPMIVTAASHHAGGVQVVLGDGAVRFVSQSVDTGVATRPHAVVADPRGPSPHGVWGALGTRDGGEMVGARDF